MNLYNVMCALAAFLILITSLARLDDIKAKKGKRWWARRMGLLMVFVSMSMFISAFFTTTAPYWKEIQVIMALWGFLITWMTTPGMPPWHKFISRNDPKEPEGTGDE